MEPRLLLLNIVPSPGPLIFGAVKLPEKKKVNSAMPAGGSQSEMRRLDQSEATDFALTSPHAPPLTSSVCSPPPSPHLVRRFPYSKTANHPPSIINPLPIIIPAPPISPSISPCPVVYRLDSPRRLTACRTCLTEQPSDRHGRSSLDIDAVAERSAI